MNSLRRRRIQMTPTTEISTDKKETDGFNYIDFNGGEGYRRLRQQRSQRRRRIEISPTT